MRDFFVQDRDAPEGDTPAASPRSPHSGVADMGWDSASLDPLRRAMMASGGPDRLSNRSLREALRPVCVAGQAAGKRAEEMVILLKTLWPTLARSDSVSSSRRDTDFERVVSIGIDEYYRYYRGSPHHQE